MAAGGLEAEGVCQMVGAVAKNLAAEQMVVRVEEELEVWVALPDLGHKNQTRPSVVQAAVGEVEAAGVAAVAEGYLVACYFLYSTRCLCFCQLLHRREFDPQKLSCFFEYVMVLPRETFFGQLRSQPRFEPFLMRCIWRHWFVGETDYFD